MISFAVFRQRDGAQLYDWPAYVTDLQIETNDHGCAVVNMYLDMPIKIAAEYFGDYSMLDLVISADAEPIWRGRAEDYETTDRGLRIAFFGAWRALTDAPYTALWIDSSYANYEQLTENDDAAALPARWQMDNNQRLYLAPTTGEKYSSSEALGMWGYAIPDGSERQITRVEFNWAMDGSSDWRARVCRRDSSWGHLATVWTQDGNGSAQSGSGAVTVTACDRLTFEFIFNASSATYSGDTGDTYARFTAPMIKTTTSADVYADEIADALVAYITGINSDQISDDTDLIESPAVALDLELYHDLLPADIITGLASAGDSSDQRYAAAVWADQRLAFWPLGTWSLTWYADLASLNLRRSIADLYNSAYGIYDGGNERTAVATDLASIEKHGLTRRAAVPATTTSETLAETYRDTFLNDNAAGVARASIQLAGIYDVHGTPIPPEYIRAHDTLVIRNLPPDLIEAEEIRSFTLSATRHDAIAGILALIPAELPEMEFLIAQQAI